MRQVFFKTTSALQAAAGTAGDARFTDLVSGELGFWSLDAATGGDWFASQLFQTTVDTDAEADDSTTGLTTIATPIMLKRSFQVVQGFPSSNPIASPIISAQNMVRVKCDPQADSTRHEVRITPAAADNSDPLNIKVIIRNTPTDYINYVNNASNFSDLSGGGYDFPLGQYNTTNHKVINLAVTGGANEEGTCDNVVAAIQGNTTWNALFEVDDNVTSFDLKARHVGVVFDVIFENLDGNTQQQGVLQAGWAPGVGNPWQARQDELKAREYAGNFNRMYFPETYTDFVTDSSEWKRYEVTYRTDGDRDVVKGSQFGSCIIYEANADDVVKNVLNAGVALTASTEYLF